MNIELYVCRGSRPPADAAALSCFSPYRRARIDAAKTERGRADAYAASLALRAALLAHGIDESGCCYEIAEGGKPRLLHSPFHFCLSHTEGGALCALFDAPIGADTEAVAPQLERDWAALVQRFFTPREQAYFHSRGESARDFFMLWTRKESYLKYTGQGITLPLSSFCVLDGAGGAKASPCYQTLFEKGFVISLCTEKAEKHPKIVWL